jgi:hypothetical protein
MSTEYIYIKSENKNRLKFVDEFKIGSSLRKITKSSGDSPVDSCRIIFSKRQVNCADCNTIGVFVLMFFTC